MSFAARLVSAAGLVLGATVSAQEVAGVPADPRDGVVTLACADGWNASLIYDGGDTGVWTVKSAPFFPQYACPEVIGLDDAGRCRICVSYSGKWTPLATIEEGAWLGAMVHGDVDPRVPGSELYVGGKKGNLYQVRSYSHGATDHRLVAHLPGLEIHSIVAGELDPRSEGPELLVFTRPGMLVRVSPTGPDGAFELLNLTTLPGRVRDAVVLPPTENRTRRVATASRSGEIALLWFGSNGMHRREIHRAPQGRGRLAARSLEDGRTVLYSTQDDGSILRHEEPHRGAVENWTTEVIHRGAPGPRGLAVGHFSADEDLEQVAIFGYSQRVELLSRTDDGWATETLFEDRDRGHWLSTAELDPRNGTRELIGSGYGGRIFMLSRPPGYGVN